MNTDNKIDNYWFINNKAYDFSKFEHPGGPIALALGKGRDATELFYSYHPLTSKAEQMLAKYQVKPEVNFKDGALPLFDWSPKDESSFVSELKRRVKSELGTHTKASTERWLQIVVMFAFVVITTYYYVLGHWWALFAAPLCHWVLGVNTFHDASHFALSTDWRVNAIFCYNSPWFSSPFTWYHQHIIGHHCYTNVHKLDPDLHHSARFWRYTRRSRYFAHYKYQCYYLVLVWSIITYALAFVIDGLFFFYGAYHGIIKMMKVSRTRKIMHLLGRVFTFVYLFVWQFFVYDSIVKAALWGLVPNAIFGLCFSLSSQLSHLTPDTLEAFDKDWYKHQVKTSHTFCPKSLFWFFFTGGLSLQIEHHLFPGVNHWHLRRIQPIVQQVCEKHGVNYTLSNTINEALAKHMALLDELSRK